MEAKYHSSQLLEINLPEELFKRIKEIGARTGKSTNQIAVELIEKYLLETERDKESGT